jgi:hypothetical protein
VGGGGWRAARRGRGGRQRALGAGRPRPSRGRQPARGAATAGGAARGAHFLTTGSAAPGAPRSVGQYSHTLAPQKSGSSAKPARKSARARRGGGGGWGQGGRRVRPCARGSGLGGELRSARGACALAPPRPPARAPRALISSRLRPRLSDLEQLAVDALHDEVVHRGGAAARAAARAAVARPRPHPRRRGLPRPRRGFVLWPSRLRTRLRGGWPDGRAVAGAARWFWGC